VVILPFVGHDWLKWSCDKDDVMHKRQLLRLRSSSVYFATRRLGRKEVNISKRYTYKLTPTLTLTVALS